MAEPSSSPVNTRAARGFTLVELLAALAILSVLAGLLIPVGMRARMASWQAVTVSSLRQLTTANLLYAADNNRFVPSANQLNTLRWSGRLDIGSGSFDPTKGLLSGYLGKSDKVTGCPMLRHLLDKQGEVASFERDGGGYGYNDYIGGAVIENYTDDVARLYVSRPRNRVPNPSRTLMFATTALARSGGVQEYPFCHPPFWVNPSGTVGTRRPSASLHFRYDGRALVSWCDGHITAETREDRPDGYNPYGGDASAQSLGWFGPDHENGYWNPDYEP